MKALGLIYAMAIVLGQVTINEIRVYQVDSDPSAAAGTIASVGSLAIDQATGVVWRKFGSLDTEWTPVIYGSNWQTTSNPATTNNNSQAAYVSQLTLSTPSLPLGDYELETKTKMFHGTSGRQVQISLLRNTVEFENYIQYFTSNVSRESFYSKTPFTAISGIQNFDIQFRTVGNGTASLSETIFIFKRIR